MEKNFKKKKRKKERGGAVNRQLIERKVGDEEMKRKIASRKGEKDAMKKEKIREAGKGERDRGI